jgi:hypothetical protein
MAIRTPSLSLQKLREPIGLTENSTLNGGATGGGSVPTCFYLPIVLGAESGVRCNALKDGNNLLTSTVDNSSGASVVKYGWQWD